MVDDYAFSGCKSIKSLRFPESTRTFGIQSLRELTAKPLIFLAKNLKHILCGIFLVSGHLHNRVD